MNTVEKGNILEKNAVDIIKSYIEKGYFGPKEYLTLKTKKKYKTKIRKGEVEFDLSIEFKLPNFDRPSLTYFIECKNHKGRLPAEKIKKFKADIDEVAGHNVKGIIISASELQSGAYSLAEAYGIMVLVGQNIENHKIILPRKYNNQKDKIPFIKDTENQKIKNKDITMAEEQIDKSILSAFIETTRNVSFGIDKLSKESISEIAENELNKIGKKYLKRGCGIECKEIISFLKKEYDLEVEYSNQIKNLGEIDFNENIIFLNQNIHNTPRELFVLAHEYGHFILHSNLSINNQLYNSFSDTIKSFNKVNLENPKQWIEWQANYFAANLIMPHITIMANLWKIQLRLEINKGNLIINDHNYYEVNVIIKKLAYLLNCSKQSVLIRLQELNLIENKSHLKRIGEIIPEIMNQEII